MPLNASLKARALLGLSSASSADALEEQKSKSKKNDQVLESEDRVHDKAMPAGYVLCDREAFRASIDALIEMFYIQREIDC